MKSLNRIIPRMAVSSGLAIVLLGFGVASACAAPAFEVGLTRNANEIQKVEGRASSGQFRLHFGTGGPGVSETADLNVGAGSAAVKAALDALDNVQGPSGQGSVFVANGADLATSGPQYLVHFNGGALANADVPLLVGSDGTVPLSGPGATVAAWTLYEAGVSRSDERLDYLTTVKNSGTDPTAGTVTVDVELPAGLQTSVLQTAGVGWTCSAFPAAGVTPAKASCSRSDALSPGATYPLLVISARLGADAPDHAIASASVSGGGAALAASDDDEFDFSPAKPFGFESFDYEVIGPGADDYTQAGGHPFSGGIRFKVNTKISRTNRPGASPFASYGDIEQVRQVVLDLPRGVVANALAVPVLCPGIADVLAATCPAGSAVGLTDAGIVDPSISVNIRMPIYAIEPEFGLPAQFAFADLAITQSTFALSPRLRADDGYAISLDASPASAGFPVREVNNGLFCSFGATVVSNIFQSCKEASDPTANPVPLVTNPTRCVGSPPTFEISSDSWQHLGIFASTEVSDPMPTGCEKLDFQPEVSITPTNRQAEAPVGVDVEITMPTEGLEGKNPDGTPNPDATAQSNLNNAIVTFPKGMSINPAAAHGLTSCAPAQVKLGSNADHECPLASQVGTIEIDTPLIQETLKGHVFVASQKDNPFNSTLGLYLVFASERDGITIKVAGELKTDPVTGQLTSSFVENPEAPFSRLAIKFNSGPRAPLINPAKCGTYAIRSELSPWSAASPANPTPEEIVADDSVYHVTSGPSGGPCPSGALSPDFEAGLKNATAGSKSPFVLKLSRNDGTDRFTGLDIAMPEGLTAYLKGIPYCPDHVLSAIPAAELSGRAEQASSACPTASQVGTVQAGAGAGPYPFYTPGRAFLAGPYKGAPLSIAVVTPAVAGPFDLGNVVVRNAVRVDPVSSEVTVLSDPIPTILHGILLDVRDIRINIDREGFMAAPTDCQPSSIDATVHGESGSSAFRAHPFQVGDCAALGFKPRLDLRLFGGTKRGAHPRLKATLTTRTGDANIARASVALPNSAFLEQSHIRTICTRVQFAANACPEASIYGRAEALTPLLDDPVSGPVFLRSSSNPLPDLIAKLRGPDDQPIEVVLAGRIDSVNEGIRSTFDVVPDQPVSKFVLTMQGGRKGLLVNSRDVCKSVNRATAKFTGQNGRKANLRPQLRSSCKKLGKRAKQKRRSSGR